MPIIRHHHTDNYTVVPNSMIHDKRLNLHDVGLLVYMISLPEDWKFSVRGLVAVLENDGREGESSIRASLKRIKDAGYLKMERQRINGRLSDVVWEVSDVPIVPCVDFTHVEKPHGENQALQSRYIGKVSI